MDNQDQAPANITHEDKDSWFFGLAFVLEVFLLVSCFWKPADGVFGFLLITFFSVLFTCFTFPFFALFLCIIAIPFAILWELVKSLFGR